jgi:hypothetical protein
MSFSPHHALCEDTYIYRTSKGPQANNRCVICRQSPLFRSTSFPSFTNCISERLSIQTEHAEYFRPAAFRRRVSSDNSRPFTKRGTNFQMARSYHPLLRSSWFYPGAYWREGIFDIVRSKSGSRVSRKRTRPRSSRNSFV